MADPTIRLEHVADSALLVHRRLHLPSGAKLPLAMRPEDAEALDALLAEVERLRDELADERTNRDELLRDAYDRGFALELNLSACQVERDGYRQLAEDATALLMRIDQGRGDVQELRQRFHALREAGR